MLSAGIECAVKKVRLLDWRGSDEIKDRARRGPAFEIQKAGDVRVCSPNKKNPLYLMHQYSGVIKQLSTSYGNYRPFVRMTPTSNYRIIQLRRVVNECHRR